MQLKRLIKRVAPPIVLDLYRSVRHGGHLGPIWEGIYPHVRDVPAHGLGHDDERWVRQSQTLARILIASKNSSATIPVNVRGRHVLLPLIASSICRDRNGVNILDFGGGIGTDYLHLTSSLPATCAVAYYVVEGEKICDAAMKIFEKDPCIHFSSSLPEEIPQLDIVQISSTLQYVEEYEVLLERLCGYGAAYVLISNLPAGDIPTYATGQKNLKGSTVPAWFFHVAEIVGIMAQNGYTLVFKGASEEEWDQQNFPEAYRIGRPCHLLFAHT